MDSEYEKRARARATWPVRRSSLEQEGANDDLSATTTPEERLAMMWPLALEAWSLTGRPLPSYTRAEMPGRLLRPPQ